MGKCLKFNIDFKNAKKKKKKIDKKFFVFDIIASELVEFNFSMKEIMLLIDCQCVNKQP